MVSHGAGPCAGGAAGLPADDRARKIWRWAPIPARKAEMSRRIMERVFTSCFPRLKERRKQVAGTLSGGEQQMLAMGRALMCQPQAADAGRAFHGSGAHSGGADFRHHQGAAHRPAPPSCWWSRTPRRPCPWPTGAMCWKPAEIVTYRHRRGAAGQLRPSRRPIWVADAAICC